MLKGKPNKTFLVHLTFQLFEISSEITKCIQSLVNIL